MFLFKLSDIIMFIERFGELSMLNFESKFSEDSGLLVYFGFEYFWFNIERSGSF